MKTLTIYLLLLLAIGFSACRTAEETTTTTETYTLSHPDSIPRLGEASEPTAPRLATRSVTVTKRKGPTPKGNKCKNCGNTYNTNKSTFKDKSKTEADNSIGKVGKDKSKEVTKDKSKKETDNSQGKTTTTAKGFNLPWWLILLAILGYLAWRLRRHILPF